MKRSPLSFGDLQPARRDVILDHAAPQAYSLLQHWILR
jgi:hypothetical protein